MFRRLIFGLLVAIFGFIANAEDSIGTITIANWNIENLFDTDDDPTNPGDDTYTPSAWRRWTKERYQIKLTNCAEIISYMRPNILVLEEVENGKVLRDLTYVLKTAFGYDMPYIIHREGGDPRGIDVAILSTIKPKRTYWVRPSRYLRESPVATFAPQGNHLTIIGNHWKSRLGGSASDGTRSFMASKVRSAWEHELKEDPSSAIIMTGDFNDDITSPVPLRSGGFSTNRQEVVKFGEKLYCLSAEVSPEKRGTYYYSQTKTWNSFDQMNVSRGLLLEGEPQSPWVYIQDTFQVFAHEKHKFGPEGRPYSFARIGTPKGHKILNGYSDHFPILIKVMLREKYSKVATQKEEKSEENNLPK